MQKEQLIDAIIEKEWPMFHNVNGDEARVDCQEDDKTFGAMRRAQYSVWDADTLAGYLADISAAEAEGRNLAREKYIRMMEFSDADGYEHFKSELPAVSPEKAGLVGEIWALMLSQTERMNEKYPSLALAGRPLRADDDTNGTSIETYQTCELLTYSEKTLKSFLNNILELEAQGVEFVTEVQRNSVVCLGYSSLESAENEMAWKCLQALGAIGGCENCCSPDDI